jgi:predicted CXXCH cytochrome family protein
MKHLLLVLALLASSFCISVPSAAQTGLKAIASSKSDIMKASDFVGSETCELCHADVAKKFASNPHAELALEHGGKGVTCESCHGGGREHVESGGDPTKIFHSEGAPSKVIDAKCLSCHASAHPNFLRSDHGKAGVSCTNCHSVHGLITAVKPTDSAVPAASASSPPVAGAAPAGPAAPAVTAKKTPPLSARFLAALKPDASINDPLQWNAALIEIPRQNPNLLKAPQPQLCFGCHSDVKPAFSQPFHHKVNEGLMKCTDCHDTHGTFGNNQLRSTADQNMICTKCHTETRGPFVFEHAPVKAEGCLSCHSPHGSQNARLLNVPNINQMCNQCHSPVSAGTIHGMGAGSAEVQPCISCHVMIHGSNINPALIR